MIIYLPEKSQLITAVEGMGDNLMPEDKEEGFRNYWSSSLYEIDGEAINLLEQAQILTSHIISTLSLEKQRDIITEYWAVETEPSITIKNESIKE